MEKLNLRKSAGIVILSILFLVLIFVWYRLLNPPDYSIPVIGGESFSIMVFPHEPYYLQTDPRWSEDTIGGSDELLKHVGCTICCVSMAFNHLGIVINPKELNQKLKQNDGYTNRGWLKWNNAALVSERHISFEIPRKPNHSSIDDTLKSGHCAIVKILLWESIPHWVLIVGKNKQEYLVKNPLNQEKQIQKLSELSNRIQSIRIASPTIITDI